VFRLAQKVIQIESGKVKAIGKPDELFIDNQISGKVQLTGTVVKMEKHDTFYLLTVVTGMNQLIKVTAFESDIQNLHEGDSVMVFTKAFNPLVVKI
jgi:molybdate transport system ATP-binding protein